MAKLETNIKKLTKYHALEVQLNISRQFKFRISIAIALIKAAAFVLGCGVDVKVNNER